MSQDQFRLIKGYYDDLFDCFGFDPRACDYGSPDTLPGKFRILAEEIDFSNKSVLEVGCGLGHYFGLISDDFENVEYLGIDISEKMVDAATAHFPAASFKATNLLAFEPRRKYQVVFAIGIFYLLRHDREETVRRLIARMFDLTEEVLAFSALSTWAREQTAGEYHLDPAEILTFCRSLSPFVRLRHDYHPREFTLFVFKEKYLPK